MRACFLALLMLLSTPLMAEEVVLGLSQRNVSITANFDGSEILIFGAVKREAPILKEAPLEVVIAVSGPPQPLTMRHKEKRFGIWLNTESVEIDSAPSFYAVATSAPFHKALTNVEDLRHKVSIPRAIRSVGAPYQIQDAAAFTKALIRIRSQNGSYQMHENAVSFDQQTLFRTSIDLPSNLTEGDYETRIFLTRNGQVVSKFETKIGVRKVGLERWLYTLSRQQPLLYGLLSLFIAISAGWGASAAFRMLRQG